MAARCPNCQGVLEDYRIERQTTDIGEVKLHWQICRNCRHVALASWAIPSMATAGGNQSNKRRGD
ncbi:MAG TPA: hypothetical protein VFA78_09790 [Chloroflexota bacterium]|nr:hypothetical protein [Chloroflexota bacterium]